MVEVPADFAETSGLGEGDKWVLSPRETRMLKAAIAWGSGRGIRVLCEPKLLLTDNKTGFFKISKQDLTIRATPRIAPEGGAILLRVEAQATKSRTVPTIFGDKPMPLAVLNTKSSETTESIPEGSTLLMRTVQSKTENETRDVFILVNAAILK